MQEVNLKNRILSDDDWASLLKESVRSRLIDGQLFPKFPPDSVQSQFVGSANESAISEALEFYRLYKGYSAALGMPLIYDHSKILDFGCGWGRFLRFFWRDVIPGNIHGVDIDPDILKFCRDADIQAELRAIIPRGKLPYPDNYFSHIFAYSVFTHLPEDVHIHWLAELARVAQPGCIFICTTEPRRFLDFVASIPLEAPSDWHAGLKGAAGDIDVSYRKFDRGEYVYIPTGGGEYRDQSVYGDAIIPLPYIEKNWTRFFAFRDYIDDPNRFWQAVYIGQRP